MRPNAYGKEDVDATAEMLLDAVSQPPRTAVLTGTGLGDVAASMSVNHRWRYADLPRFPHATVTGHRGELLAGTLDGHGLWVCMGRLHLYEGHSPAAVTFPIRVLQTVGVDRLILTNAAGGIDPAFSAGDLMIITDHINLTGENPLLGPNVDAWGMRFPDMHRAYHPGWIDLAAAAATSAGLTVRKGVYAGLKGPSLETPAEVRYLRRIGADAVGFSTVMETISAVHAGMQVLAVSLITNVHDPERPQPTTLEEVLATAEASAGPLGEALKGFVASRVAGETP
jgi:purine-nucleoside phosphorylase